MSTLEVNTISPISGSSDVTLGGSSKNIKFASGTTVDFSTNTPTLSGLPNNTPMFSAYGNGTTVGNNSYTKLEFQNEVYDTDSAFDNSSNYRFTVPSGKGGYYNFNLVISPDNGVTFSDWRVRLYKNGSSGGLANGFHSFLSDTKSASGDFPTITGSCVVNLSAGDYIEVYGFHNSGSNRTFNWPFFQGNKLIT
tara:strand:- start:640 stop:1221 length:582 start_codon:yes stop_codon:yes gene_type:complete